MIYPVYTHNLITQGRHSWPQPHSAAYRVLFIKSTIQNVWQSSPKYLLNCWNCMHRDGSVAITTWVVNNCVVFRPYITQSPAHGCACHRDLLASIKTHPFRNPLENNQSLPFLPEQTCLPQLLAVWRHLNNVCNLQQHIWIHQHVMLGPPSSHFSWTAALWNFTMVCV